MNPTKPVSVITEVSFQSLKIYPFKLCICMCVYMYMCVCVGICVYMYLCGDMCGRVQMSQRPELSDPSGAMSQVVVRPLT